MERKKKMHGLSPLMHALMCGVMVLFTGMVVHVLFGYHAEHAHSPKMKREMVGLAVTLFFAGFFACLMSVWMGWHKTRK